MGGFEIPAEILWDIEHPNDLDHGGWFIRDGQLFKTISWEIPDEVIPSLSQGDL